MVEINSVLPKKIILLDDRSGAELDDKCGQAYFWNRKFGGIGIVPKEESKHLTVGALTHEDMHMAATMEDISETKIKAIVDGILDGLTAGEQELQQRMEMLYRRLGWFIAWLLFMEPAVRETYETITTEAEMVLDRDPLWVSVTPDRIVRHRSSGHLEYWEYKTTISASTKWMMSWVYKIQLHLGIAVVQEELEKPVKHAHVIGLMKGTEDYNGNLRHPYVYAYHNTETQEWTHDYQKARSAAWTKRGVWFYPDGLVAWVKKLGSEVALAQFPMSPPVALNADMLNEWTFRRKMRLMRINRAPEHGGNLQEKMHWVTFEKKQNQCRPPFGDQCPYLQACWNAEIGKDPIGSGIYVKRQPHHQLEIIGVEI